MQPLSKSSVNDVIQADTWLTKSTGSDKRISCYRGRSTIGSEQKATSFQHATAHCLAYILAVTHLCECTKVRWCMQKNGCLLAWSSDQARRQLFLRISFSLDFSVSLSRHGQSISSDAGRYSTRLWAPPALWRTRVLQVRTYVKYVRTWIRPTAVKLRDIRKRSSLSVTCKKTDQCTSLLFYYKLAKSPKETHGMLADVHVFEVRVRWV